MIKVVYKVLFLIWLYRVIQCLFFLYAMHIQSTQPVSRMKRVHRLESVPGPVFLGTLCFMISYLVSTYISLTASSLKKTDFFHGQQTVTRQKINYEGWDRPISTKYDDFNELTLLNL